MRELDDVPATDMDEAPLNLEVGLDEFPDVLAGIDSYDVDSQGEYASKLDLAKAYLEMNDSEGARDLLEEIALQADNDLQSEAKALLGKMKV
ncbi:probable type IV pilus assembly FimV-related transmembrane protein [Photobacterium aphoticum]|nr:probable type IV pilus assembly FimV-related transmembrane protein [Photobacterium aphoticum]